MKDIKVESASFKSWKDSIYNRSTSPWEKKMKLMVRYFAIILAGAIISGCEPTGPQRDGAIQVINAITDSPTLSLELKLDENESNLGGLNFQDATPVYELANDTYSLTVRYVDPNTEADFSLITNFEFDVKSDTLHSLVLKGSFSNPSITILDKDLYDVFDSSDDINEVEVQVFNLSSDIVSVYLGDPNSTISDNTLLGAFGFDFNSDPTLIEDEENSLYRIRITGDDSSTVLYDSGAFDIPAFGRRLIVVNDGLGPDPDTKSAFIVREEGASVYPNEIANSGIRFINAIAEQGVAEIEMITPSTSKIIADTVLAFSEITNFVTVEPAFYNVEVASNQESVGSATVSLNQDTFYTIIVGGSVLDDAVSIQAASTTIRPIATASSLQFVNGLRSTTIDDFDRVDLYALPAGDALADAFPTHSQVGFLSSTSSVIPATTVDLVVTTAGTQSILAGPTRFNLKGSTEILVVVAETSDGNELIVHSTELLP
jgi:hypothetical protein